MASDLEYQDIRDGAWRLKVLAGAWSEGLWQSICAAMANQPAQRHPQTLKLRFPEDAGGEYLFLKIFDSMAGWARVKDLFRASKALRSLRQGVALSRAGFDAPIVVAAGERRRCRVLQRAFVVTRPIDAQTVPMMLLQRYGARGCAPEIGQKRKVIDQLARQISKLHRLGFVHGDLIPSNVMIALEGRAWRFYFLDNDRTCKYPAWLPQSLWKRNLVQLNRFALPGISLQDRLRFFRAYRGRGGFEISDRRLLRWLEQKTRARRQQCERIETTGSFRILMQWDRNVADRT